MKKVVFVVGGARSGKSTYAVELAKSLKKEVIFLATCTYKDAEMEDRIEKHKKSRPADWKVITEGKDIARAISKAQGKSRTLIVDCLGLWVANLMEVKTDRQIEREINVLVAALAKSEGTVILVSNEVGCGLVPPYPLGRRFRDLVGRANQVIACAADEVFLMQVGLPMQLKGKS